MIPLFALTASAAHLFGHKIIMTGFEVSLSFMPPAVTVLGSVSLKVCAFVRLAVIAPGSEKLFGDLSESCSLPYLMERY